MSLTPDRFPGIRNDEGIDLESSTLAVAEGQIRYDEGRFSLYDGNGEYDPRSSDGSLPQATQIGQVLFSIDGTTFTVQLPLTCSYGWLVNNSGNLIVVG